MDSVFGAVAERVVVVGAGERVGRAVRTSLLVATRFGATGRAAAVLLPTLLR